MAVGFFFQICLVETCTQKSANMFHDKILSVFHIWFTSFIVFYEARERENTLHSLALNFCLQTVLYCLFDTLNYLRYEDIYFKSSEVFTDARTRVSRKRPFFDFR